MLSLLIEIRTTMYIFVEKQEKYQYFFCQKSTLSGDMYVVLGCNAYEEDETLSIFDSPN